LPLFFVNNINLSGGKINYIDKTFEPAVSIEVSDLALKVIGLSLDAPFYFETEGALLSEKKDFKVKGRAKIEKENLSVKLNNVEADADLSALTLKSLLKALPVLESAGISENPKGKIQVTIPELVVGTKGLTSLTLDGKLSDGNLKFKQLAAPLSSIKAGLNMNQKDLQVKDLSLQFAHGTVTGVASLNDYLSGQNFSADLIANGISLGAAVDQSKQPVKLVGLLSGKATLKGSGLSPEKTLETLSADAQFSIKDGKLTDINVLRSVLDKISMLPDLVARIQASLPERYKAMLTQKDTIITKANALAKVEQRLIHITDTEVEADGFLFQGTGQADFNQQFSMAGKFYIPEDLSISMTSIVPELKYLLDENKRILIPVQASGKGSDIKFSVDLEYLGKQIFQNRGKEELGKMLEKLFKKEEKPAQGSEQQQQEQPAQEGQTETQQPGSILDKLFK